MNSNKTVVAHSTLLSAIGVREPTTAVVSRGPDQADRRTWMSGIDGDWSKPAAMAIPKEGYFELERGRYGPLFPRTPACYGFSILAKVKEGREETVRAYGKTIEETIA